jgi:hypothetical protein
MGAQAALAIIFALLAWVRMRRLGPRRRKG